MKAIFKGGGLDGVKADVQLDKSKMRVGDTVHVTQLCNIEGLAPGKARPLIRNSSFQVKEKGVNTITLEVCS